MVDIKPALKHNYLCNSHHPEHCRYWQCNNCSKIYPQFIKPENVICVIIFGSMNIIHLIV